MGIIGKRVVTQAVALILLAAASAEPATIFDNSPHDGISGTSISDLLVAEDFTISVPTSLTGVRFWSAQASAADYAGTIDWFIYADSGGSPGGVLFSASVAATNTATGSPAGSGLYLEFQNDFSMSVSLAPGTYWLGLHDGPVLDTTFRDFYWGTTAANATSAGMYQELPSLPWIDSLLEHAFVLSGDQAPVPEPVPEPGTLVLAATGLGALAAARRLRCRRR